MSLLSFVTNQENRRGTFMSIQRHHPSKILCDIVQYENTVYLAGVVADDLTQDVKGQTSQVLKRVDQLLSEVGSNKSKVLTAQVWLNDIRHRNAMNEVWLSWVDSKNLPARACVEAKMADPTCLLSFP